MQISSHPQLTIVLHEKVDGFPSRLPFSLKVNRDARFPFLLEDEKAHSLITSFCLFDSNDFSLLFWFSFLFLDVTSRHFLFDLDAIILLSAATLMLSIVGSIPGNGSPIFFGHGSRATKDGIPFCHIQSKGLIPCISFSHGTRDSPSVCYT